MALSNTQHIVLAAACQRPDRSIYPLTTKLPGGAAAKVLGSLLNKNLVKEVPAKRADTIWREDNKRGRLTLRATPDAFKALGVDEAPADTEAAPRLKASQNWVVPAKPASPSRRPTASARIGPSLRQKACDFCMPSR